MFVLEERPQPTPSPDSNGPGIGSLLSGYVLEERLGSGGYADVYRARRVPTKAADPAESSEPAGPTDLSESDDLAESADVEELTESPATEAVAIKVLRDPTLSASLRREAQITRRVTHEGMVRTIAVQEQGAAPHSVHELVEGRTLRAVLAESERLEPDQAADVVQQVAEILAAVHDAGVCHGDVKPGNVMIEPSGRVRLVDFGLGQTVHENEDALELSQDLSTKAALEGTIAYMAPEQRVGAPPDATTDIYGLGLLLFECVTGRLPQGIELPTRARKGLDPRFDTVFQACYAPRERRAPRASAVVSKLSALRSALARAERPVEPDPFPEPALAWRPGSALMLSVGGLVLWPLALVAGALAYGELAAIRRGEADPAGRAPCLTALSVSGTALAVWTIIMGVLLLG